MCSSSTQRRGAASSRCETPYSGRTATRAESAVASVADAAMAVAEQVPGLDQHLVRPVLCFAGDHQIEGWARDVMLCTSANLVAMLLSRPRVLDAWAARSVTLALQDSLGTAGSAAPSPNRRVRPRRSRSIAGRGIPRRMSRKWSVLGFVLSVALLLVGVSLLPRISSVISQAVVSGLTPQAKAPHDAHQLGSATVMSGGTRRAALRVSADRAGTVHRFRGDALPV